MLFDFFSNLNQIKHECIFSGFQVRIKFTFSNNECFHFLVPINFTNFRFRMQFPAEKQCFHTHIHFHMRNLFLRHQPAILPEVNQCSNFQNIV